MRSLHTHTHTHTHARAHTHTSFIPVRLTDRQDAGISENVKGTDGNAVSQGDGAGEPWRLEHLAHSSNIMMTEIVSRL